MRSELTNNWIVCRVCLKKPNEPMHTIFDESDEKDLTEQILRCGGVPIKRFDHFPDKICRKCLNLLKVAHKFRQTCQRSHQHLSKFIAPVILDSCSSNGDADVSTKSVAQLDDESTVSMKMEPTEENCTESEGEFVKAEANDDIVDIFEPMNCDILAEEQSIECNLEEEDVLSDSYERIEEQGEFISSSEIEEPIQSPSTKSKNRKSQRQSNRKNLRDSLKLANGAKENDCNGDGDDDDDDDGGKKVKQEKVTTTKAGSKKRSPQVVRQEDSSPKKDRVKSSGSKKKPKESSFICDICGNIYPTQGRLTEHIKLHRGIKPYDCEICGHAFAQTQQLARHMNTHTGRRPYKCNYCHAAFADLSTRNKHHRIHTNERPYVCDVCGKTFTYTNTLKFHKMIHTGEKPHVCDICGKGFQQKYKMRNHRLIHERKELKDKAYAVAGKTPVEI